ncbi:MAG: glycosyltransferase family 87 protein, partial [Pseudomonadota bacterium]
MRAQSKSIFFIMGLVTLLSAWRHAGSMSPDLLASWMAGLNFARGAMDEVYFASTGLFTMRPPETWVTELHASGYDGAIYPFIYPPLWAWAMSKMTAITSFETLVFIGNLINPLLIMGSILLAARMAARHLSSLHFLLIGIVALGSSVIAVVALEQNQPQILVSFLLVLAAERTRGGDPRTAGIALALAASIKLYPAVFAIIWLAQ